jgi:putative lipoprotein
VGYRERVALPADAVVDIWITDITPGIIVPAVITAETSFKSGSRQVPLPFELTFDPDRIVATHRYGVRAVIKSGGNVLFQSESPTPVITQGNPTQVQLMLTRAGG